MMTNKKRLYSILAVLVGIIVCFTLGIVFALDKKEVSAENATEYETYDVLYTDDFTVNGVAGGSTFEVENGKFLNFTPSAGNTSASFVWNFKYTATKTTGKINIYPLASGSWGGTYAFDLNNLEHFTFTQGQIYNVELGVLKIKGSNNFNAFVKVNGNIADEKTISPEHNTKNDQCAANGCPGGEDYSKHTGVYFYVLDGAKGTCNSARPQVKFDKLTNSDWKIGGKGGASVPNEWEWKAADSVVQYIDFNPSPENTTGSFVWEFDFLCTTSGLNFNIFPFAGHEWPGTQHYDIADFYNHPSGFTAGEIYKIEVGVIATGLNDLLLYFSVDGRVIKQVETLVSEKTGTGRGDGLSIYFNGACRGIIVGESTTPAGPVEDPEEVSPYADYVDTYDTLYNMHWTVKDSITLDPIPNITDTWTMQAGRFFDYQPSATNTTRSFVWKFKYTHIDTGAINIFPFTGGYWVNTDNSTYIDFHNCGFEVGMTYNVELCLLKKKDSADYDFFAIINGTKVTKSIAGRVLSTISESSTVVVTSFANNYNGLYISGSSTSTVSSADYLVDCEKYDVLDNVDWKLHNGNTLVGTLPKYWTPVNANFINFTPSAENTTGSFIWNFKYTMTASGTTANVYPLASGSWGSGSAPISFNSLGLTVGTEYDMQFGVIKIKNIAEYYLFIKADGNIVKELLIVPSHNEDSNQVSANGCPGGDDYSKHTGIYFNIDGYTANFVGERSSVDLSAYVDTYDTLYNQNWTVKNGNSLEPISNIMDTWTLQNGYFLDYKPSATNTTHSFIWKFKYTHLTNGNMVIYPFAKKAWEDTGAYMYFHSCGFETNQTYDIELCLLKLKDSTKYDFFVVVDGVKMTTGDAIKTQIDETVNNVINGYNGLYCYFENGSATGTVSSTVDYVDVLCENYDLLDNVDWKLHNGNTYLSEMPRNWIPVDGNFIDFTPSAENTTGSFIWNFKYTVSGEGSFAYIYPLASGYYGSAAAPIDLNALGLNVGTTYDMQLCVLRIINSYNYYICIKANGNIVKEISVIPKHNTAHDQCTANGCSGGDDYSKHTGVYFYLSGYTASFVQEAVAVSVNGGERVMVDSGTTIYDVVGGVSGLIPADRPSGYSVAWYDENGNKLNALMPITDNITIVPFYTYNYKILNVNGEEIYKNKHVYGETESYNGDKLSVGRTTFIGYLVGDKLYQDLAEAIDNSASSGKSLIANTISFGLVDGASVRIIDEPTIRFSAAINKSEVDEGARIVDFGMLLTTKSTLDMIDDFTIEELDAVDSKLYHNFNKESGLRYVENAKYAGQYVYSLVLNKVSLKNYCLEYAARAYAIVEYEDGTQKVVYSGFDKVDNVRSMYDVAVKAIADTNANYTNAQIAIIQKVIDGVVNLDDELTLTGPERNYTLNILDSGSGDYTVTINPLNGFSIASIGAVLVNGEQIPVYNANLVNRSFVIKDDDMCVFTMKRFDEYLANYDAERELVINAYSGPSIGLKVNASGSWENSGYNFTLDDLKTYMDAGFDSWRLEISPYTSVLGYTANGTTYNSDSNTRDIYKALDLAAEYARTYGKPCAIYVNIPEVTGLVTSDLAKIKQYYDILTNYDDGITGRNGVPSAIAGKHNQIAGFLLKDEPSISQVEAFTTIYNYLKNTCGANASGYKYMISLLQTYAGADLIGNSYEDYVATYSEILSDTTIGFDSYPFAYEKANLGGQETYSFVSAWYYNMQVNRAQANGYGTCIQSYTADSSITNIFKSKKYKKINSEQEISMQVYTALAYGFTNIDYFTYGDRIDYDRQVREEIYQQVPVKWNNYANWSQGYTKTDMYYWIQNTNSKAISLYEVLGKFTSNGVQLIHGTTTFNNFGEATTTNTTNAIGVSSTYDMVVGGFNCGSQNGYLAVNVDFPNGSKTGGRLTTATFNLGNAYTKAIVYIDGEERVEHLTNGSLTLKIASGEAAFIVPMN